MQASAIVGSLQGTSSTLTTMWKVLLTWKTGLSADLQPEPALLESTGTRKGEGKVREIPRETLQRVKISGTGGKKDVFFGEGLILGKG